MTVVRRGDAYPAKMESQSAAMTAGSRRAPSAKS